MIKARKLISVFLSAAMLVTMFGAFTTVAFADEAAPAYTVHLWETFENGNSASMSTKTSFTSREGKYGSGAKYTYSTYNSSDLYAQIDFALSDTITVAEALANNLTVEVEFDYYSNSLIGNDNFFYLASGSRSNSNYAAGFRIRSTGQTKILNYPSSEVDVKSADSEAIINFHTFKVVLHAEKAGYQDPNNSSTATATDGWVLDGFYYDGVEQKSKAKYTLGGLTGTNDFTNLFFRFKSNTDLAGEIGLDNVSVISYSGDSSPAPDRHAFMDKVLTYTDKVGTAAYNSALALYEKAYITTDEINEVYYMLEGSSDLYTIDDIYNSARAVKVTSNDTIGGKPILIVGAFVGEKLTDAFSQEINISNGSTATISFPEDFEVADKASLRAFIFASVDCLVPLAKARKE